MGNAKYSDYLSSNGYIKFNSEDYNKSFDNIYTYLRVFNIYGEFKVYINNSKDYILIGTGETFELKDFSINSLKLEPRTYSDITKLQFILLR